MLAAVSSRAMRAHASAAALALSLALSMVPAIASARAWHGLNPGTSTKAEVVKKFGSPTRELPMTARYASGLIYQAKESEDYGAEEAQFFFDDKGKLTDIFVFPAVALKKDDIVKAYGTAFEERRTDDFRLYFQYKADGFVVFFDKDNDSVYQLEFTPGTAPASPPPAAPAPAPTTKPSAAANPPPATNGAATTAGGSTASTQPH